MVKSSLFVAVVATALGHAADPCTLATSSKWVSSEIAHACELAVPYNQTQALGVVDSALKSLPYYSLENWFLRSPNPRISHNVDIRSLLQNIQHIASSPAGYASYWDFNIAVTDAFNREQDGHTVYVAACTEAFSWNLPFSIGMLAPTPFSHTTRPIFLANYDFPNQNRSGLEAYYQQLGLNVRAYDGVEILTIDGVDAAQYLSTLATESSIYDGIIGGFEDAGVRFMRLLSRYSADTEKGYFTQEIGRFGQRSFYPGQDNVTIVLQTAAGTTHSLTIPWAATFVGDGKTTKTFISKTCALPASSHGRRAELGQQQRKAVIRPDAQPKIRGASSTIHQDTLHMNYVQPNLTSFGHLITLDIYQLKQHPDVGVVYFEQFEPAVHYNYQAYFHQISATLHSGLTALKKAGVKHMILDISGNRGGYINAGAIALWSLWPKDLYPGFPAVFRVSDLIRRESDAAVKRNNTNSEYFFGNYMSTGYAPLSSNEQFMDPPVPQMVNGIPDEYSHPFFDFFGNSSAAVTKFTTPPFAAEDYVIVSNGICASTCSIFSSYLAQKHGVRSAVFGARLPGQQAPAQFDGGVKGSEVTEFESILNELAIAGLKHDKDAPQPFPIRASLSLNFRNALPYKQQQDGILEYVWEPGTRTYQFTAELYHSPEKVWEFVAEEFFCSS
uniref:Tail specific protease domain-containing protein n=1 Tax=Mycena chlorophos TaxID=658473 RepID=A0ABQ0L719_MYCCL|nr:predicted protein [Mycena chlorophos]